MAHDAADTTAPAPELEGWIMKRSKVLHAWRARWLTLWAGQESRWVLEASAEIRGEQSECFDLERVAAVRAVEREEFGRPHCFVVEYYDRQFGSRGRGGRLSGSLSKMLGRGSGGGVRNVGFQASSTEERDRWVQALERAAAAAEIAAKEAAAKEEEEADDYSDKEIASDKEPQEVPAANKEETKGDTKGKGKGKGPLPPPPSPAKAAAGDGKGGAKGKEAKGAKGQAKGTSKPETLPFGRRMTMWSPTEQLGQPADDTVFDGLFSDGTFKVEENIRALQSVFQSSPGKGSHPPPVPTPKTTSKETSAKQATVLSSRDAQNMAIVLRCMPVRGPDLISALENLQPGPLDAESLQRLEDALPKQDVLQELLAYSGPEEALRDVDRQLRRLAGLPRLPQRLRALRAAAGLGAQQELIARQLGMLQAVCAELRASRTLRQVFAAVLVMFNYVNFGKTGTKEARAFDVGTLLHLDQFKAKDGPLPNFNGLHFVAMRLLSEEPAVKAEDLYKELEHLLLAVPPNIMDIQNSIAALQTEAQFLHSEREDHPISYGGQPPAPPPPIAPPVSSGMPKVTGQDGSPQVELVALPPPTDTLNAPPLCAEENAEGKVVRTGPLRRDSVCTSSRRVGRSHGNFLKDMRKWLRAQGQPALGLPQPLGGVPPPAQLMMGRVDAPTAPWKPVNVEIPAPGLLLFSEEGGEAHYAVIAGAQVVLLSSPLASLEARAEAEQGAPRMAFELQGVALQGNLHSRCRLWLGAEDPRLSSRWLVALRALAEAPGAGFLWVKDSKYGLWRWRWAATYNGENSKLLVWYRTPGELLREEVPIGGVQLGPSAKVETLAASGSSEAGRCPFGFRVKAGDGKAGSKGTLLSATNQPDMERWLGVLHGCTDVEPMQDVLSWVSGVSAPIVSTSSMPDVFSWISVGTGSAPRLPSMDDFLGKNDDSTQGAAAVADAPTPPTESPPPEEEEAREAQVTQQVSLQESQDSESPSEGSSIVSDEPEAEVAVALRELGLIGRQTDACTEQLTQGLDAATAECRRLLTYFRQQKHDASLLLLSQQMAAFFAALRSFAARLRHASTELAKHRQACRRRGQPDPEPKQALSLFQFQAPAQKIEIPRWSWQQQLKVKQAAHTAVAQLVEQSLHRICARALLQRAVLRHLGAPVPKRTPGAPVFETNTARRRSSDRRLLLARGLFGDEPGVC